MSRYIYADALYKETAKKIKANNECRMAVVDDEFLDLINDAYTEDVVDVVRCKDCKWCMVENWDGEILYGCDCAGGMNDITPDSYCSFGERKKDGKL